MSTAPVFSIVIPTRNRPTPLQRCLAACAQLDFPQDQFEVIVVDDGGDPGAVTLAPFQAAMKVALVQQSHTGPASARNTGAARAQGTFVAFTDDDCAPAPAWLRALQVELCHTPGNAVGGRTRNALGENIYSEASQVLIDYLYAYYNRDPRAAYFLASNNFAAPRTRFDELGGFDVAFPLAAAEDRDFCDRWVGRGFPLVYAPDALVSHSHPLTFRTFFHQHWRYGRGAARFHRARARRGYRHIQLEPPRFYRDLISYPFVQKMPRAEALASLLMLTQIANALGFFGERARS